MDTIKLSVVDALKRYFLTRSGANSISGHLVPGQTETINLGSVDLRFDTVYAKTIIADSLTGGSGGVTDHGDLTGLSDDDHTQYLNAARHNLAAHVLGTNVPHDDHGLLSGLGDDDHTQYLNATRHNLATHVLGTNIPHDDHGALSGLADDDHSQYLNNTRHDVTTRHTLGTVVPHDDHTQLSNKGTNTHVQIDTALTRLANTSGTNTGDQVVPVNTLAVANNFFTAYNSATGAFSKAQPTWANIDKTTSSLADIATRVHSALSGLGNDDHTQYLNNARHDLTARHTLGTVVPHDDHGLLSGLGDDDHTQYLLASGLRTLAGNLTLTGSILPVTTDASDIGSSISLFRKAWISELDAVVFAENTAQLIGGWLVVAKGEGSINTDMAVGSTTVDFGKAMTVNDIVLFRASGKLEYMKVGAMVSGTIYNVTRNLDGTGADAWATGSPYAILGQGTGGRIELNAYDTPRLSIFKRTGTAWNNNAEIARFGDINGLGGIATETYGIFIGDATSYLKYDGSALTIAGNGAGLTSINGGNITSGTISADRIAALSITADKLAAGSITGDKLSLTTSISICSDTWQGTGIQLDYNGGNPRVWIGKEMGSYFSFDSASNTLMLETPSISLQDNGLTFAKHPISGVYPSLIFPNGSITAYNDGFQAEVASWLVKSNLRAPNPEARLALTALDAASTGGTGTALTVKAETGVSITKVSGATDPNPDYRGNLYVEGQITTGTTGLATNLNADKVDGLHAATSGANAHVLATDASGHTVITGKLGLGAGISGVPPTALGIAADAGTILDANNYGRGIQITRAAVNTGQHIALVRSGNKVWSIGYVYNTNDFAIGNGQSTDSNFAGTSEFQINSANGVVSMPHGILASGTSFPASPTTGQQFFRSDLGWWCYWNGTYWLTANEYTIALPRTVNIAGSFGFPSEALRTNYRPFFTHCVGNSNTATTVNDSNCWYIACRAINQAYSASENIYTITFNASNGYAAGVDKNFYGNLAFASSYSPLARVDWYAGKNGNPGNLSVEVTVYYKLIIG